MECIIMKNNALGFHIYIKVLFDFKLHVLIIITSGLNIFNLSGLVLEL